MPDDKVFDMKQPGHGSPSASGRPVIVGHHPTMADPMLRPMSHTHPSPAGPISLTPHDNLRSYQPSESFSTPSADPVQPAQPAPVFPPTPPAETSYDSTALGTLTTPPLTSETVPVPSTETPPAPTDRTTLGASSSLNQTQTVAPLPGQEQIQHAVHHELPIVESRSGSSIIKKVLLLLVLPLLLIGVGAYLVLDAQLVDNKIKLPYEFFKEKTIVVVTPAKTNQSSSQPVNKVPTGYSAYDDSALPFSFNYPTSWGAPTVTTEQGFTKRGGDNKSDGTYAYLVGFATNRDVQMAITSSKYLPPARGTLYYDFLSWCVNPADKKIYKSILAFTTSGGIDTPTQPTCNQGSLSDATTIDASTIVQADTKAADGSSLGDVYTKNLSDPNITVVRIKDATRKNGADIKIILNNDLASSTN